MSNFEFLKSVDENLYEIIYEAEKLFRDEYFTQCVGQTRKFGEHVCRNILAETMTSEATFDDMLATLKDKPNKTEEEKEFLNDLYFIKREGNAAVHNSGATPDSIVTLECLKRAFEIAINYTVYYKKAGSEYLDLHYDTEMLITGKKTPISLAEKYQKAKAKNKTNSKKNVKKQIHIMPTKNTAYSKEITFPFIFVGTATAIGLFFAILIYLFTL